MGGGRTLRFSGLTCGGGGGATLQRRGQCVFQRICEAGRQCALPRIHRGADLALVSLQGGGALYEGGGGTLRSGGSTREGARQCALQWICKVGPFHPALLSSGSTKQRLDTLPPYFKERMEQDTLLPVILCLMLHPQPHSSQEPFHVFRYLNQGSVSFLPMVCPQLPSGQRCE